MLYKQILYLRNLHCTNNVHFRKYLTILPLSSITKTIFAEDIHSAYLRFEYAVKYLNLFVAAQCLWLMYNYYYNIIRYVIYVIVILFWLSILCKLKINVDEKCQLIVSHIVNNRLSIPITSDVSVFHEKLK